METKIQKLDKILENLGVSETPDNLIGTKLDYIIDNMGGGGGGTPQVQSDWNETDASKKSFIKNKPTLLKRVRLTADDNHIYKDGTILTFENVKDLVMNSDVFVTVTMYDNISFIPSAYDTTAIWFDSSFIEGGVPNQLRLIINDQNQVKIDQIELATNAEISKKTLEIAELKMLGWNVPDECPIKNEISGNQFIQKVGRVDIGTFYWIYRASDGFMTTNYQVPSKTIAETDAPKAYCDIYKALPRSGAVSINNVDKSFALPNKYIVIHDSTYTDSRTFMDNVKGVYVYYELENPITKKIDGNEGLITKEILEGQKLNKISMEGEFDIWTDGDNARIDYEDNYFIMEGDSITIHNNAGNASKITMNDGDIKMEGCPDAGTTIDAMIHFGTNDGIKSYINMTADTLKFNGSDIATIDALQPVWISNLMSDALYIPDRTEAELKLLSRQIVYVLEHYNFMVLKCFIDDGNETLVRNVATSASSGDGFIVCPIITEGNYRKVYEYMLLGDEVHCICLSFMYDKSTKVLHFSIAPCWNAGTSTSWAYSTQYDAITNIKGTFSEVTIEKMAGFVPYTGEKTMAIN